MNDKREIGQAVASAIAMGDVTPELLEAAENVHDGWFSEDPRVDWEEFVDATHPPVPEAGMTMSDQRENVKPPPMQDLANIAMYCQTYADGYVKDSARAVIRWMNTLDPQPDEPHYYSPIAAEQAGPENG